jgi:hypothetical protein
MRIGAIACVVSTAVSSLSGIMVGASPTLRSQTITPSSLPSGWSREVDSDNGVGCLQNLLEPAGIKQTSVAETYYAYGGRLPFLDEKLATYSNAKKAFTTIARTIAACHHPSGPFKGYQTMGTVTPFHYATVASQSVAYHMVFTTGDETIYYDYLIARKNKVIVAVLEGGYPAVSSGQFASLVTLAVSKIAS